MRKKALLMISNSQVLMDITVRILGRAGYTVRCAIGLEGAREQLQDYTPDGIILGNELPDGSGFDYLREQWTENRIPVLYISSYKEDELAALNAGATDFLKRPYDFEVLITRINKMLSNTEITGIRYRSYEQAKRSYEPKYKAAAIGRLHTVLPIKQKSAATERKNRATGRICIGAAACLAFVLVGALMYFTYASFVPRQIPDIPAPLTAQTFLTNTSRDLDTESQTVIGIPGVSSISIPADTRDIKIPLINLEKSPYYTVFELVLADAGETLYKSDIMEPGTSIGELIISRGFAEGDYNVTLYINLYEPAGFTLKGSVNIGFILTAMMMN